jgi:hypothetical protein
MEIEAGAGCEVRVAACELRVTWFELQKNRSSQTRNARPATRNFFYCHIRNPVLGYIKTR